MTQNRPTLGRGLAALLGESNTPSTHQTTQTIDINALKPGRNQPRQEFSAEELADLVQSIQRKGILQPLIIRQQGPGTYEIIAGERRWRAAKEANLSRVPVVIITCNDQEALEIGLIENLQRHDLNPIEEADAIKRLQEEFKLTQEQIAISIGKSRSYVANMIRISMLEDSIKNLIRSNKISAGHARALITAENPNAVIDKILGEKLSVRDTEQLVKKTKELSTTAKAKAGKQFIGPMDSDIQVITDQLAENLNMKVNLVVRGENGSLTINFQKLTQLDILLERLNK